MTRVFSFDVFDTVLTRAVGSPSAVPCLLGRKLQRAGIVSCSVDAFVEARLAAERRAYEVALERGDQVRLVEICAELQRALGLTPEQAEVLQREEVELEARLLRVVPAATEWLAKARASGGKIAFLSDTPLPESFLREQLQRHGLLGDDLLLVSSECGSNKADSAMYRELGRRAGVPEGEILHQGNHRRHDIDAAERVGLRTRWRNAANLNRYEERLDRDAERTAGLATALAGASRLARLQVEVRTPAEEALRDVSAGVVGPLLVAYVTWILREARRRGVTSLWFLARDGQVLLELARILAPKLGVQADLRYLLASRQAWNLPAVACGVHADLVWIWDHSDGLSVRGLLARVGIDPAEVATELASLGLSEGDWSRPLRRVELVALRGWAERESFRARVRDAAGRSEPLLRRYLEQEGVIATENAAVVELVGHGNLQESLTAVLTSAGGQAPVGFYLAVMRDERERCMGEVVSYLDREHSSGLVPGFAVIALEAFCAADHGTLVGFEEGADGVVCPILDPTNSPVTGWGLDVLRRTVVAFARELVLDEDLVDPDADVRGSVIGPLQDFWMRPSPEEAAAWGRFPWEDGFGAETRYRSLARAYSWMDVARALRRGRIVPVHRAAWRQGSLVLTPRLRRGALRAAARLSRMILTKPD